MTYQDNKSGAIIRYGDVELARDKFHDNAIEALIRRGVSHFLGNEVASKVKSWADQEIAKATKAHVEKHGEDEEVPEDLGPTDEEKAAKLAEFRKTAVQALYDGTIGQGSPRGPRLDPVESAMSAIAKQELTILLTHNGLKWPKKDEKVKFADAEYSADELLTRWLSGRDGKGLFGTAGQENRPRIKREAEKRVAEAEKKAKKAKEAAGGEALASADLGF